MQGLHTCHILSWPAGWVHNVTCQVCFFCHWGRASWSITFFQSRLFPLSEMTICSVWRQAQFTDNHTQRFLGPKFISLSSCRSVSSLDEQQAKLIPCSLQIAYHAACWLRTQVSKHSVYWCLREDPRERASLWWAQWRSGTPPWAGYSLRQTKSSNGWHQTHFQGSGLKSKVARFPGRLALGSSSDRPAEGATCWWHRSFGTELTAAS